MEQIRTTHDRAETPRVLASDVSLSDEALYEQLHQMAGRFVRREPSESTLGATSLVHEVYLKLQGTRLPALNDEGHLMAICARLMRQILVTHARRRRVRRRASGDGVELLDRIVEDLESNSGSLSDLDAALDRLRSIDERKALVVELRTFGGFNDEIAAELLGISTRTFRREWAIARGWLRSELGR